MLCKKFEFECSGAFGGGTSSACYSKNKEILQMKNWENIDINSYTKSKDVWRDCWAIENEIGDMNILNPKSEIYREIAYRLYEKAIILQMREEE